MKNSKLSEFNSLSTNELCITNGGLVLGVDCVVAALVLTVPGVIGAVLLY